MRELLNVCEFAFRKPCKGEVSLKLCALVGWPIGGARGRLAAIGGHLAAIHGAIALPAILSLGVLGGN